MKETKAKLVSLTDDRLQNDQHKYADKLEELKNKFDEALDDDFNTAQALGHVFETARLINNINTVEKKMPMKTKKNILDAASGVFSHFGDVLGIFQYDPDSFFQADRGIEAGKRGLNVSRIESMIRERQKARADKDWSRSDDIRRELSSQGVILKDSADHTTWLIE
jgi:cysteinyl-tRNA synthetase